MIGMFKTLTHLGGDVEKWETKGEDTRCRILTASATGIHQKQQNLRTCRPMNMPQDPARFYIKQIMFKTTENQNRNAHRNHKWL